MHDRTCSPCSPCNVFTAAKHTNGPAAPLCKVVPRDTLLTDETKLLLDASRVTVGRPHQVGNEARGRAAHLWTFLGAIRGLRLDLFLSCLRGRGSSLSVSAGCFCCVWRRRLVRSLPASYCQCFIHSLFGCASWPRLYSASTRHFSHAHMGSSLCCARWSASRTEHRRRGKLEASVANPPPI